MDLVRYDQLVPSMYSELPGCEKSDILLALRRVGIEFCQRSGVWLVTLDAVNAVAEQADYTLAIGFPAVIDLIEEVRLNTAAGVADGDEGYVMKPQYYYFTPPTTLTFTTGGIPSESVTGGIEIDAYLIPEYNSNEVPAILLSKYGNGIRSLALAELQAQVGHPWSNNEGAMKNRVSGNRILNQAISDRDRSFSANGGGLEA